MIFKLGRRKGRTGSAFDFVWECLHDLGGCGMEAEYWRHDERNERLAVPKISHRLGYLGLERTDVLIYQISSHDNTGYHRILRRSTVSMPMLLTNPAS
jgi:hypothetical protein